CWCVSQLAAGKKGQRAAKTDRRTRYGQCGPASTRCPACTIMSHDQQRAGPIDVGMWLRGLGLGQYEAAFRENETDNAVSRAGRTASRHRRLVERFQSSNHMGCSKRPHPWDGKSKMQLWDFMESVV